jgi:uncharacterized protein (UPF0261 family)
MSKTIVIAGTLDTKGHEFAFVKQLIEAQGLHTLMVDFGVLGEPAFDADIDRAQVARAGGGDVAQLRANQHKDEAMRVMADGLAVIVSDLFQKGQLHGMLGMGGSGGTSIATRAMRALPIGVPKVMLSTVGGGNVAPYAETKDITFMPSIVDVAGLNRISRRMYANAAGAIVGMVRQSEAATPESSDEKPLVAASMFGNTTACVDRARGILEAQGYEVLVFHATGTGGRTMESLISDGYLAGSMDITTTEIADAVCGGVFSAGPERMLAAARAGIPTLLVPGCVDMCNFAGIETVPEKYRQRKLYQWNPNVTLMRTNAEENAQMGHMIAQAANQSRGPVCVLLPLKGVSMLDSVGNNFWDPDADAACFQSIKAFVRRGIEVIEMDANINDSAFADRAAQLMLAMLATSSGQRRYKE